MTVIKNNMQAVSLPVTEGLMVTIIPNSDHEFLIPTKDVAAGYGVCSGTIRKHSERNAADFTEGIHYVKGVTISNTLSQQGVTNSHTLPKTQPHQVFWTKAGVIRLGFFIKSERAKLFRDWAERLILAVMGQKQPQLPALKKRRINRMTPDRIIDLLSDVCLIENRELRERIADKLKGGYSYGN